MLEGYGQRVLVYLGGRIEREVNLSRPASRDAKVAVSQEGLVAVSHPATAAVDTYGPDGALRSSVDNPRLLGIGPIDYVPDGTLLARARSIVYDLSDPSVRPISFAEPDGGLSAGSRRTIWTGGDGSVTQLRGGESRLRLGSGDLRGKTVRRGDVALGSVFASDPHESGVWVLGLDAQLFGSDGQLVVACTVAPGFFPQHIAVTAREVVLGSGDRLVRFRKTARRTNRCSPPRLRLDEVTLRPRAAKLAVELRVSAATEIEVEIFRRIRVRCGGPTVGMCVSHQSTRTVRRSVAAGRAVIGLPRLPRGTYAVRVAASARAGFARADAPLMRIGR